MTHSFQSEQFVPDRDTDCGYYCRDHKVDCRRRMQRDSFLCVLRKLEQSFFKSCVTVVSEPAGTNTTTTDVTDYCTFVNQASWLLQCEAYTENLPDSCVVQTQASQKQLV